MRRWILIGGEFVDGTFGFVLVSFGAHEFNFTVLYDGEFMADR